MKNTAERPKVRKKGLAAVKGLYEKRGWFYYQPPIPKDALKGTPRPKALALWTQSLTDALRELENKRSEILMNREMRAGTMDEALPAYYLAKAGDAKATRLVREVILKGFSKATGNPRLTAIDREMIVAWRKTLADKGGKRGKPVSLTTLCSYTITLRAFLTWAREQGMIQDNPLIGMSRVIRVRKSRVQEFLTEDDREKLLAAKAPDYVGLILRLGFFAGLRDGEMLAFNPQWLWLSDDGERGTLTVQNTPIEFTDGKTGMWQPKGRERRTIPLHPRLLEFIKSYGMKSPWMLAPEKAKWPEEKKQSKRFDAGKALAGVAKRAGVKHVTTHLLRHSFATHLAMKGVALAEIAGLLGDSLRVTEEHYAGYQPGKGNPLGVL